MLKGFRDFLLRGNVVDLAVAVIIGTAFSAVVTSLNKDVITQLIAAVGGVPDFSQESFSINGAKIGYGNLITTIINFVIVASVVYFVVVVPMNKALEKFNKADEAEETEATLTKDQELLIEIRDALRAGKTL